MKAFFETYAKKRRFDPLIPEHWYKQTAAEIYAEKVLLFVTYLFSSPLLSSPI